MYIKHQDCGGPVAGVHSVPDSVGEQMALQGSWRSGAPISCDTCDPVRQTVLYGFTAEESQDESQGWRGEFLWNSPPSALHGFIFY